MAAITALSVSTAGEVVAQEWKPEIHGTIRAKYEYQYEREEGRFEVRNARFSVSGKVTETVAYKAEIDLSDEGEIKMLDAYTRLTPVRGLDITVGQIRVPFTVDAHRSPHLRYFANRSFIAKQVGNVRDVGATMAWQTAGTLPITVEAGFFNGSGLTNQKNYWTKSLNFSAKARMMIPQGWCFTLSTQKIRPGLSTIMMYNAALYYHNAGWHVEGEYLYKHYSRGAYGAVHSFDGFVNYDIGLKGKKMMIKKVSPLARWDYMSDHSDGVTADESGCLVTTDYRRSRLTGGVTLSLATPFVADIRLNYEKYFYREGAVIKPSEHDKIVLEVMTRF